MLLGSFIGWAAGTRGGEWILVEARIILIALAWTGWIPAVLAWRASAEGFRQQLPLRIPGVLPRLAGPTPEHGVCLQSLGFDLLEWEMALDSPEAYERLGEHLKEIDPIFQAFLQDSGYSDETGGLGRYPHRSAMQEGEVDRIINLQMEYDERGERFAEFEPSVPYSLWRGAWVDMDGRRYIPDRGVCIFERLPFAELVPMLAESLREAAEALQKYTKAQIIAQSEPFDLLYPPSDIA